MQKKNKTYVAKSFKTPQKWYEIDAQGKVLGRLAGRVAAVLRGKHRVDFTPHVDCRDFVVVVNAAKVKVTGKKKDQKYYFRHSGYPGGHTLTVLRKMLEEHPEKVIVDAVRGMLPKGRLGRRLLGKLKVVAGAGHSLAPQKPEKLEV
jgi:large subunit ribosomal protein L13